MRHLILVAILLTVVGVPHDNVSACESKKSTRAKKKTVETEVRSFVLRDPCTQKPLRRTRYRLFNNAEPGFLVMGKTNRKGETVEVKVSKGEEIHLIPVVGQGRYGRAFVLEFEK